MTPGPELTSEVAAALPEFDELPGEEPVSVASAPAEQSAPAAEAPQGQNARWDRKKSRWERRKMARQGYREAQQGQPAEPPAPQYEPLPPDTPPLYLKQLESVPFEELVSRLPLDRAEDAINMRRHEVIMELIRVHLKRRGTVVATGTLELVNGGFGFLRAGDGRFRGCRLLFGSGKGFSQLRQPVIFR